MKYTVQLDFSIDEEDAVRTDEEVISYEEWSQPEDDIQNGLTVVVKGEWISG